MHHETGSWDGSLRLGWNEQARLKHYREVNVSCNLVGGRNTSLVYRPSCVRHFQYEIRTETQTASGKRTKVRKRG